jgi:hypothetical protein
MSQFVEVMLMGEPTLFNLAHVTRIAKLSTGLCIIIDDEGHRYEPAESYEEIRDAIAALSGRREVP